MMMKQPKLKMLFEIIEKTIPRCENMEQVNHLRHEVFRLYSAGQIDKDRYVRWSAMLDSVTSVLNSK